MYGAAAWQAQSSTMHAQPRTDAAASQAVGPLHYEQYHIDPPMLPPFQAPSSLVFPENCYASSGSPGAPTPSQNSNDTNASGPPFYWAEGGL